MHFYAPINIYSICKTDVNVTFFVCKVGLRKVSIFSTIDLSIKPIITCGYMMDVVNLWTAVKYQVLNNS